MDQESGHLHLAHVVESCQPATAQQTCQQLISLLRETLEPELQQLSGVWCAASFDSTCTCNSRSQSGLTGGIRVSACMGCQKGCIMQEVGKDSSDQAKGTNQQQVLPDVCVGEGLGGIGNLSQDLARVAAAEHGQLVHRPVPAGNGKASVSMSSTSISQIVSPPALWTCPMQEPVSQHPCNNPSATS